MTNSGFRAEGPVREASPAAGRKRRRWPSAAALVAFLGPIGGGIAYAQADPPSPEPQLKFFLTGARGQAGNTVTVEFGIFTDTPVKRLSVALNFDESVLRFVAFRRHEFDADGVPAFIEPVDAAEFDNRNAVAGNQTREGWIHIQLEAESGFLDFPLDERVSLVDLDFVIDSGAQPGTTEVTFESVVKDDTVLGNEAELAAPGGVADADFDEDDFEEGRIEIIGEVGFFLRADVDMNCERDITDAVLTLDYLFLGGAEPPCLDAADADDSGSLDIADPITTLEWLFRGGSGIPEPLRTPERDLTEDDLDCAEGLPSDDWDGCTLTSP